MGTEAELAAFKSPHDVVITTQRLRLRPIYPLTDIHAIHRMRTNPNSMKYMTTGPETEEGPLKSASFDRMRLMTAPGSFSFAVELKPSGEESSGEIIGFLGLFRPPSCGYLIDEPYWGKGYATEASKGFVEKYWENFPEGAPGLKPEERNILTAHVFEGNTASEAVLKKTGFRECGKEVEELPSGRIVRATVFKIERPEKVPIPADVAGLPT
ncbi:putative N-acetyltransferase domain-containing protein [Seiridium cardinale]|uniref:N-acetyltransferase domain-containing protein n=1 Tax=Seiridium cardinale TaxID=138064 RepID=A0ABR2XI83_9PEZI